MDYLASHLHSVLIFSLDDARARTRELPGSYPFVVQESFIKTIVKQWEGPAQMLCKSVSILLMEHLNKLVTAHFGSFGQGGLEQRVRSVKPSFSLQVSLMNSCRVLIQNHVKECMERAEERVTWLLALEDQPFSLNTHYLADYQVKFLAYYKGARERDCNAKLTSAVHAYGGPPASYGASSSTGIEKVLAGLVEIGMHSVKPEDLAKLLPPDVMEPALGIMADIRAYFQGVSFLFVNGAPRLML